MKSQSRQTGTKYFTAVFVVVMLLLQFSCKDKIEGCMDITAVNWDASADRSCDDCCTYPSLTYSIEHNWLDTLIRFDTTYLSPNGMPFQITGIRYYLSDFKLFSSDVAYAPRDSLEVELYTAGGNEEKTIDDNFALVSTFTKTGTIGIFRNTDLSVDSVVFSVGLHAMANAVDPVSVTVGHPLAIDSDSMFQSRDSGYIFAKIGIVSDTLANDTTIYRIVGNSNRIEMRFNWSSDLVRGTNVVIPIKLKYSELFMGINFATDTPESIKGAFVNNLSNTFIIDE